ncbi:Lovastatin diketide synthase LovF [Colletotrichum sp. SAR 10_98]|nr:Lovastatin diketide synthase LovF [Colletotrichum sp. SAR 10_98]
MGEHVNVSRGPGDDPVVVCGMAMRLPGGVSNADDFWDMLMQKRCASVPVPKDRFNISGYYSEKPRPGTMQTKKAYFLDHVQLDRFDASHFSYGRKLEECTSALVAGCSLFLSAPLSAAGASGALGNIASPDGVCKTFDAASDGIGRGEAINAVYIKRLSQALRDGNPVRAVIRSIATQHDGREPGLIIPNGYAQEALIRHTYDKAGITKYSETSFFECHGTGTRIGDLTEVGAIERIFREEGVIIGAVKPNVGHSEGAAALTSVIKVILMLEKGVIAPNTNFNTPNPNRYLRTSPPVVRS